MEIFYVFNILAKVFKKPSGLFLKVHEGKGHGGGFLRTKNLENILRITILLASAAVGVAESENGKTYWGLADSTVF